MKKIYFLFVMIFISGCATNALKKDLKSEPQQDILHSAKIAYAKHDYNKASKAFLEYASYFPASKSAKYAQIQAMYINAILKETEVVESLAEDFLHQYPRSAEASYAYYLRSIAPLFKHSSVLQRATKAHPELRGADLLNQSFQRLKAMVRLYPQSKYTNQAKIILYRIKTILALHENDVAEYYYSKGSYQAAINRAMDSIAICLKKSTVLPALSVMQNSYMHLGKKAESDAVKRLLDTIKK